MLRSVWKISGYLVDRAGGVFYIEGMNSIMLEWESNSYSIVFHLVYYTVISYASNYGQKSTFSFIFSNDCRKKKKKKLKMLSAKSSCNLAITASQK